MFGKKEKTKGKSPASNSEASAKSTGATFAPGANTEEIPKPENNLEEDYKPFAMLEFGQDGSGVPHLKGGWAQRSKSVWTTKSGAAIDLSSLKRDAANVRISFAASRLPTKSAKPQIVSLWLGKKRVGRWTLGEPRVRNFRADVAGGLLDEAGWLLRFRFAKEDAERPEMDASPGLSMVRMSLSQAD